MLSSRRVFLIVKSSSVNEIPTFDSLCPSPYQTLRAEDSKTANAIPRLDSVAAFFASFLVILRRWASLRSFVSIFLVALSSAIVSYAGSKAPFWRLFGAFVTLLAGEGYAEWRDEYRLHYRFKAKGYSSSITSLIKHERTGLLPSYLIMSHLSAMTAAVYDFKVKG